MAQILAQHTTKEDTHMPHFTETGRCQRHTCFYTLTNIWSQVSSKLNEMAWIEY